MTTIQSIITPVLNAHTYLVVFKVGALMVIYVATYHKFGLIQLRANV